MKIVSMEAISNLAFQRESKNEALVCWSTAFSWLDSRLARYEQEIEVVSLHCVFFEVGPMTRHLSSILTNGTFLVCQVHIDYW